MSVGRSERVCRSGRCWALKRNLKPIHAARRGRLSACPGCGARFCFNGLVALPADVPAAKWHCDAVRGHRVYIRLEPGVASPVDVRALGRFSRSTFRIHPVSCLNRVAVLAGSSRSVVVVRLSAASGRSHPTPSLASSTESGTIGGSTQYPIARAMTAAACAADSRSAPSSRWA